MTPEDLKRRMRFSHPDEDVSMRNKNYRWTQPVYEIKNIRRDAEDPSNSTVYYEDMRGNKYKTNAQMFVERFGDFYIESAINHAIKLLAQVPGYDSPTPAVENENPASIPRSCPNCGYMAMGSEINSAIENGESELKCPRCGFSINIAPDEQFLMAREKMSKLKSAIDKFGQWKENIMDLSDELYYPTAPEMEDPKMNRIRQLEEELGLEPMDLAELGVSADEYLVYLEDEAGMWKGKAKKAQKFSPYSPATDPSYKAPSGKGHPLGMGTLDLSKLTEEESEALDEADRKRSERWEKEKERLRKELYPDAYPLPMKAQSKEDFDISPVLESLKDETKAYEMDILEGMARCLFVNAWADFAEEQLDANFSQMELMDVAPETPPESFEKAKGLYNEIEEINNVDLSMFTPPGTDPDEGFDENLFGHYLCMEALGHGVSWRDDHEDHGLKLPNIEAYADMDFSEATLRQMYEEFEKDFPEGDYIFESEPVFETKGKKEAAYSHSFSPEFYGDVYNPKKTDRPTNVVDALASMSDEEWNEMAKEVFNADGDYLDLDIVMSKILETDTVGDLTPPVDVWIDEEGYFTVDVYDEQEEETDENIEAEGTWYSLVNEGR